MSACSPSKKAKKNAKPRVGQTKSDDSCDSAAKPWSFKLCFREDVRLLDHVTYPKRLFLRPKSSAHSAIERLITIIRHENENELETFLSTVKGFQYYNSGFGSRLANVFHIIVTRDFETAEEAEEWLGYFENQDIDEKYIQREEVCPLHYACKWGIILGVKWLVSHGANINVEEIYGRTPYSWAITSDIDMMEKLLCLEERGYDVLPADLVHAAKNNFSSYEEANELFHHLVNERGIGVNAVDVKRMRNAPLHIACDHGNIFCVKWLVEHNADIDSANDGGLTPFLSACGSYVDRMLKVRYLDEKGADCSAIDRDGSSAIFHALYNSNDAQILRFLVLEKGLNVNLVDKRGATPLLSALRSASPTLVVIRALIDLGADVSVTDLEKQNALHRAAGWTSIDVSIIFLLLEKGVNIMGVNENGRTPVDEARNGEIRQILRQHYDAARFSVLLREKVCPNLIKMCVVGYEMAGKTTFVNSLLQLNRSPIDPKDRTPGIDIHKCDIPGVGKGTIWDFGSQPTFHSAHGIFFQQSNTLFCLIFPIREEEEMTSEVVRRLLENGRFWCAFSKAALRKLSPRSISRIPLLLIFNRIGFNVEAGREARYQLKEVAKHLQRDFGDTFDISFVIEMDCSNSQSERMSDCRTSLKQIREAMLEAADYVPKLCHTIEEHLSLPDHRRKKPLAHFLMPGEFEKWVAEEVGITLNKEEKKVAVEFLDSSGIIIDLGRQICIQPPWLCSNVIGPLLAPPYFVVSMPAKKSGIVSKEDIRLALTAFENHLKEKGYDSPFVVSPDEAIEILLYLDLCIQMEASTNKYQIPALLHDSISYDTWSEDLTLNVYRGQRYECACNVDIISPSSFVVFQCRSYSMENVSHKAWKDGVKLVKIVTDKVIECLVTLGVKKEHCSIDVVFRWSRISNCEEIARQFLAEIKSMITKACDERSPGVVLDWFYLDSSHLKQLDEDPAIYSSIAVEEKFNDAHFDDLLFSARPDKVYRASVKELVIGENEPERSCVSGGLHLSRCVTGMRPDISTKVSFPGDDELLSDQLMTTCSRVCSSRWEEIAACTIDLNTIKQIRKSTDINALRLQEVLHVWKTADSPTVRDLLRWLKEVGVSRKAIEDKFQNLYA